MVAESGMLLSTEQEDVKDGAQTGQQDRGLTGEAVPAAGAQGREILGGSTQPCNQGSLGFLRNQSFRGSSGLIMIYFLPSRPHWSSSPSSVPPPPSIFHLIEKA